MLTVCYYYLWFFFYCCYIVGCIYFRNVLFLSVYLVFSLFFILANQPPPLPTTAWWKWSRLCVVWHLVVVVLVLLHHICPASQRRATKWLLCSFRRQLFSLSPFSSFLLLLHIEQQRRRKIVVALAGPAVIFFFSRRQHSLVFRDFVFVTFLTVGGVSFILVCVFLFFSFHCHIIGSRPPMWRCLVLSLFIGNVVVLYFPWIGFFLKKWKKIVLREKNHQYIDSSCYLLC